MARVYDRPITIQRVDEATEQWADVWHLHASVNKAGGGRESVEGGAIQAPRTLTFTVRWFKALEEMAYNTQAFRLLYGGRAFDVTDYDDYMEQHRTVKLTASSLGVGV